MLDYKFLLIIILSMIVYFLYRRIEKIEYKVKNIENNDSNDNQPIELALPEDENKDFQLPLPQPETPQEIKLVEKSDNFDTISFPFNATNLNSIEEVSETSVEPPAKPLVEQPSELLKAPSAEPSAEPLVEQPNKLSNVPSAEPTIELIDININKLAEVENMINEIENVDMPNIDISNLDDNTLEEYSNEQSDVQIYSNDNEEEHHSSLMESMVEAVDGENDNQIELDTLLKNNKLPELQQIAENLNIDIHKENSKKKTKLELATDILNNKK